MQHVVVDAGEYRFKVFDDPCAKYWPKQRTGTAKNNHQNDRTGLGPLHAFRPCEWIHRGQQSTGQASIHTGNNEGSQCVRFGINPRIHQSVLVGFNRAQHQTERRAENADRYVERRNQYESTDVEPNVELQIHSHKRSPERIVHL